MAEEVRVISGAWRASLAESPVWSHDEGLLYFIDSTPLDAPRSESDATLSICAVNPSGGAVSVMPLPNSPGCIVPSSKGGFLAALSANEDGTGGRLMRVTPSNCGGVGGEGTCEIGEQLCDVLNASVLVSMADGKNALQCLNDGACDAKGRVWVGSKVLEPPSAEAYLPVGEAAGGALKPNRDAPPIGALFCCEQAWSFRDGGMKAIGVPTAVAEVGGVHVSNGIGWSPDGATMYYADSPRRCVMAYDFDVSTGFLSNARLFAAMAPQCPGGVEGTVGVPDGLAVDAEGGVWVCLWDGGRVVRYTAPAEEVDASGNVSVKVSVSVSESGEVAPVVVPVAVASRVIEMPCSRPTSCCFGGAGTAFATTLFITSCSFDGARSLAEEEPLAGAVFAVEVGVEGVPVHKASF